MVSKQKIRRKLAQADFTDDVIFGLVMSQLEICRKFLKAVLPQHDFTKLKIIDQSHLKTDYLSKAGRLDIHCTDVYGNQFDIELQMTNEHNVAQRSKYYHALMANHMLTAGEEYQALKATYVIFLCPASLTDADQAITHYEMVSRQSPKWWNPHADFKCQWKLGRRQWRTQGDFSVTLKAAGFVWKVGPTNYG